MKKLMSAVVGAAPTGGGRAQPNSRAARISVKMANLGMVCALLCLFLATVMGQDSRYRNQQADEKIPYSQ